MHYSCLALAGSSISSDPLLGRKALEAAQPATERLDLMTLAWSGRERTQQEFELLPVNTGFRLISTRPTAMLLGIRQRHSLRAQWHPASVPGGAGDLYRLPPRTPSPRPDRAAAMGWMFTAIVLAGMFYGATPVFDRTTQAANPVVAPAARVLTPVLDETVGTAHLGRFLLGPERTLAP
jgi:hypothetical protein